MSAEVWAVQTEEDRFAILRDGQEMTHVPFCELDTPEGVAFWWRQLAEKRWMTPELMKELGQRICGRLSVH